MDDVNTTTPVACTLPISEQKRETQDFRANLGPHLLRHEMLDDGVRISFRNLPSVCENLNRLVELDSSCCRFLTHQIDEQGDEIILTTRSHGSGIALAQQFVTELSVETPKISTKTKIGGTVGVIGLACATPLLLSIAGIGMAGSLGAVGIEIAVLGLALLAGIIYFLYQRHILKGKTKNANRCGC